MEAHKSNWAVLDRTAYFIEQPQYVPTSCAEVGQLLTMLAKDAHQNSPQESPHTH